MRMRRVFTHNQPVFFRERADFVHITRKAPGVHWDHCLRVLGEVFRCVFQVEASRAGIQVDEDGNVPKEAHGQNRGEKVYEGTMISLPGGRSRAKNMDVSVLVPLQWALE